MNRSATIDPSTKYQERRADLLARMARDLRTYDAYVHPADAVRCLFGRGYAVADVMMLAQEARHVVFQEIVAEEMSKDDG
jgi:hypothetical protein